MTILGIVILLVIVGSFVGWAITHMAAPRNSFEQTLDDQDQLDYLKKEAEKKANKS